MLRRPFRSATAFGTDPVNVMPGPDQHTRIFHKPILWIALASLLAVTPLLLHGPSCGHDLSFHLRNWMEVGQQWRHGTLRPFWCFTAAWNAGEPRFVFYPPFSWTLGALLGTLLPWKAVPTVYTLVILLFSGLAMHRLLRHFVVTKTATLGACLYLVNPYMLFVALERSAEAELLAAAWTPLLLLAALRFRNDPLRIAVAVALLWLTNAPAAVVGSYALLVIGSIRLIVETHKAGFGPGILQAAKMVAGYVLGLAIASFYLLPAIVQRRDVQIDMAILPGMRPQDNFLFGHIGEPFHVAVLHTASWIAVFVLTVALLSSGTLAFPSLWSRRHLGASIFRGSIAKDRAPRQDSSSASTSIQMPPSTTLAILTLTILTLAIAFLLTPASLIIWRHAPELAFLQFPWRFLAVEAAAAVLLLTLAISRHAPARNTIPAALVITALAAFAAHSRFAQPCDEEDAPQAQRAHFLYDPGTEPTDEYTPKDADNDALHPHLPVAWLAASDDDPPSSTPNPLGLAILDPDPSRLRVHVAPLPLDRILVLRQRAFRGWQIQVDGIGRPAVSTRDDGLISLPVRAGLPHEVGLAYRWTADEKTGTALSCIGVMAALGTALRRKQIV